MEKTKKNPPTARTCAVEILCQVFEEGAYTNIALSKYLRNASLSNLDRHLLTELVYGTAKAKGTLDWYLKACITRPLFDVEAKLRNVLRVALFQLLYMDRIPASAAVNEAVKTARALGNEGSAKFVNGVLRGFLRKKAAGEFVFPSPEQDDAYYLALKYMHPKWLVKRWLGPHKHEGVTKLLEFNNSSAPVCLRANTLFTSRTKLLDDLKEIQVQAHPSKWSTDGLVIDEMDSLADVFAKLPNAFYVQDESSMLVADVLAPEQGESILDMCAAPGGKTTHLAERMQNTGEIIACDVHEHKLKLIRENAKRLGINNIKTMLNDGAVFRTEWAEKFDRVLVDAPCSGMGVLRRRAEARWTKDKKDLKVFPPLQLSILKCAARYVKPGGRLVYSTCTIEQAENHYLIEEFLQAFPTWQRVPFKHPLTGELLDELQIWPHVDNIDGFYICALERK
ncbi:MAG: 16S rRNA (cytosine(967)-C(5))-methyltransferase RsmB [Phascolarctobacterium sp.]|nr:16S rRNA (cytosine(967)-C(5))-methyltransferase RsmB [Phascolarctobacterium sp.]